MAFEDNSANLSRDHEPAQVAEDNQWHAKSVGLRSFHLEQAEETWNS